MIPSLNSFLLVGAGGCLGACARYYISNQDFFGSERFFYTLLINVVGCFLIGVLWVLLSTLNAKGGWHNFLITGMLGGFTTFSTYSLEWVKLMHAGRFGELAFYTAASILLTLLACMAGYFGTSKLIELLK